MRTPADDKELAAELRELIERYRAQCLWFLREDFYLTTSGQVGRVLGYIERYGDREAFVRSGRIRQWLSRNISAESAG
jgi:hypothetical protein